MLNILRTNNAAILRHYVFYDYHNTIYSSFHDNHRGARVHSNNPTTEHDQSNTRNNLCYDSHTLKQRDVLANTVCVLEGVFWVCLTFPSYKMCLQTHLLCTGTRSVSLSTHLVCMATQLLTNTPSNQASVFDNMQSVFLP